MTAFMLFLQAFRFIKHYRERQSDSLRGERDHQLAVITQMTKALEVLVEGQVKQAEQSTIGLLELAKSNTAQAEAFSTWIKSFQITSPPTSSFVTEEDEWQAEQDAFVDSLPEEFRLAKQMQDDFLADVRKDTKS